MEMRRRMAHVWYVYIRPRARRTAAWILRVLPISSRKGGVPKGVIADTAAWIEREEKKAPGTEGKRAFWRVKVRDGETFSGMPPHSIDPVVPPIFDEYRKLHFPELTVTCIRHGRVATTEGTVISPDDLVFEEFAHQWGSSIRENSVFIDPGLPRLEHRAGVWATLVVPASGANVGHWLMDGVLRLSVLEAAGLAKTAKLIIPDARPKFAEPIEALGYGQDRYAGLQGGHWEADELLVPSYTSPPGFLRPWACRWLRERLGVEGKPAGRRRLWISRSRARWRRVVNEEELLPVLERAGFERIELERLAFREQVELLSQAGAVAGPHGAGMTDLLFAPRGIRVLELFPPEFINPVFYSMANALDQEYHYFTGSTQPGDRHPGGSKDLDHFRIVPDRLEQALRSMNLTP
jgi:hypothetical protein